ncbi:hypothetical protein CNR22_21910 [Sphingobacteriaceae bacterium]|nr:hypothetical protein CNR22_21910 [Sphingobacteriaceae bacterium]
MKNHVFIVAGLILFLLVSCSKKEIAQDSSLLGLEYYPTDLGKFVIYDIDSTVYTQLPKDTLVYKYRIKEKLVENFTDNTGQPAIRIERSVKRFDPLKSYDSIPWTIKEAWMINANKSSIQVVESNQRITKLIFPVQEKISWDGNANNTLGIQEFTYDYIDRTETIASTSFPSVLLVKQKDYRTLISYEYYIEKYAKGVGLVSREIKDLLSNTIVANMPVESRIESGIIYKQTLVTYGYE